MFRENFLAGLTLLVIFISNFVVVSSESGTGSSHVNIKAAELEVFCPSGIQISIPQEKSVTSMVIEAVHRDQNDQKVNTWFAGKILPENNLLTFEEHSAKIRPGDKIFLRISVTSFGQLKDYLNETWKYSELVENSSSSSECLPCTTFLMKTLDLSTPQSNGESVQLDVFYPSGFQISVLVPNDVNSMTFLGRVPRSSVAIDPWVADHLHPENGRVIYKNCTGIVKLGNVFVYKIKLTSYEETDRYMLGSFRVHNYNATPECEPSTMSPDEPVHIDVYYPSGFQVSIPAETDSVSMNFNGMLNRKLTNNSDTDTWNADNLPPKNGRLAFKNSTSQLRIGDVIYYRLTITQSGQIKQHHDGVHVVTKYINAVGSAHPFPILPTDTTSAECKRSITVVNGIQQKCADRLIFNEQFSGNTIDTSKWTRQERFAGQPDYEFVTYLMREEVIYVNNGLLFIHPKRLVDFYGETIFDYNRSLNLHPNCTGEFYTSDCLRSNSIVGMVPPIASGQITTKGYFSFMYGSIRIRARLPNIPWSFLQFYLEPSENAYGNFNLSSGKMRVAFLTGSDTCLLSGGIIFKGDKKLRDEYMCKKLCDEREWSSDFHVYSLEWTPAAIILSVDGEQYCQVDPMKKPYFIGTKGEKIPTLTYHRPTTEMAPFDHPFHITIGIGFGGHFHFPDGLLNKPWTNLDPRCMQKFWSAVQPRKYPKGRLQVDYIQVFTV